MQAETRHVRLPEEGGYCIQVGALSIGTVTQENHCFLYADNGRHEQRGDIEGRLIRISGESCTGEFFPDMAGSCRVEIDRQLNRAKMLRRVREEYAFPQIEQAITNVDDRVRRPVPQSL